MFRTSAGVAPPRRAVQTESRTFSSPSAECESVEHVIRTPASIASRTCSPLQVEPRREPVHLDRDPALAAGLEDRVEVERVRRPVADQPPGRMAQARDVRALERRQHALRQLGPRRPLPGVHGGLHPVELGEHVVRQVERPVGADVALDRRAGAGTGASMLVRGGDLLALAPDSRRRRDPARPGRPACGRRSRGTRSRARLRRPAHLEHAGAAVRPGRVAVQVAAQVGHLDEARRLARERLLAQLRRAPRHAERAVGALLVRRGGQRLERLDVRRGARRPQQRRPRLFRRGDDELDRHALDRHPERPPLFALDDRDDLRQRLEPRRVTGAGSAAAATTASSSIASQCRRTAPATSTVDAGRDRLGQRQRA